MPGSQWWTDYQPVTYVLTSKRGNRAQYQAIIETCHAAGVKVIADTIFNHMAGSDSGTGVAGDCTCFCLFQFLLKSGRRLTHTDLKAFTHYNYPGYYEPQDFHYCNNGNNNNIQNYDNGTDVQDCQLENLAE